MRQSVQMRKVVRHIGLAITVSALCSACTYDLIDTASDGSETVSESTGQEQASECQHSIGVVEDPELKEKWDCSLSEALMVEKDVVLGAQVRVHVDGQKIVCTVRAVHDGYDLGMNEEGLERLGLDGPGEGCVPGTQVPASMSEDDAKVQGEVIETLNWGSPDHVILAPHGFMHYGTKEIADLGASVWLEEIGQSPTQWVVQGWAEGGGEGEAARAEAKNRWFVKSQDFSELSYEGLADLQGEPGFERVLSILGHDDHGDCAYPAGSDDGEEEGDEGDEEGDEEADEKEPPDIMVGGGNMGPKQIVIERLKQDVAGVSVEMATVDGCEGKAKPNIVNRLNPCGGVQLSLRESFRHEHMPNGVPDVVMESVITAVVRALNEWNGC